MVDDCRTIGGDGVEHLGVGELRERGGRALAGPPANGVRQRVAGALSRGELDAGLTQPQTSGGVDYALIAMTQLAVHPGERFSARSLAETYALSGSLMANVIKALAKHRVRDVVFERPNLEGLFMSYYE